MTPGFRRVPGVGLMVDLGVWEVEWDGIWANCHGKAGLIGLHQRGEEYGLSGSWR